MRVCPLFVLALSLSTTADAALRDQLAALAPDADRQVIDLALTARDCAQAEGLAGEAERLAVIDYARPSTQKRLWVFELGDTPRLLYREYVAHGRESGDNLATRFSNREGSHQSSLGLFRTAETYFGGNGYSLRLDGLEPGINDQARERAIVMHGAPYVNPKLARELGRLGRSYGCPAVREKVARPMIDALKQGQLLFAYYPDRHWEQSSALLSCRSLAKTSGAAHGALANSAPR